MGGDDEKAAPPTSRRDDRESRRHDRDDEKVAPLTSRLDDRDSRRDYRDSRGKRHSSRTEREPSPKRLRRDGKPATERPYTGSHRSGTDGLVDNDQKSHRRLHDALPLEVTQGTDTKVKSDVSKNDPDGKGNHIPDGIKHSSDPRDIPRFRSYFQHDSRSTAVQGGQRHDQRTSDYRRWDDQKYRYGDRVKDKEANDLVKNDRFQTGRDRNNTWRHDRFFEREADAEAARKRRPFTEKKRPVEREGAAAGTELGNRYHHTLPGSAIRDDREIDYLHKLDKSENPFDRADDKSEQSRHRFLDRVGSVRTGYQARDRYGGRGMRGRERYSKSYDDRSTSHPAERQWKHDGFDEVNRSPVSKNTEEQIAKIEALLAL